MKLYLRLVAPNPSPPDEAMVDRLRDLDFRNGYLAALLADQRNVMAWIASDLRNDATARQLLARKVATIDETLDLIKQADSNVAQRSR